MNLLWVLVLVVLNNGLFSSGDSESTSTRPEAVKIGTIFAYSSDIGKVAKIAVEAAVEDVNSNPAVLGGTKLELIMQDSNYSYFLAMTEALRLMENDIVAIVGPQSSVTAHLISHIANELQVPLVSFSATDPTLSVLQFPFFVRTTQNDLFQMAAIAEIIEYFEWSQVIAIYGDDDFGRNGIAALADQLAAKRCQISLKAALRPQPSRTEITDVLVKVALEESRVLVLQTDPSWGLDVLAVAQHLGMMGGGYVWIATNWLSTVLDTSSPLPSNTTDNMQGLITLRMYTPDSELKRNFVSRWHNLTSDQTANGRIGLNTYGLYAYDTVWMLAHAIGTFLDQGGNISFSNDSRLSKDGGNLHLDAMSIFDGGNLLLDNILQVNFTGLTGPISFDSDRSLIHPAYEVINVVGTGIRKIGYWSNYSGLSVVPPDTLYSEPPNRSLANQHLYGPVWPGQTTEKPRGWGFPSNGRQMKIAVPNRLTYNELVQLVPNTDHMFKGYCIDVFTAALSLLPYAVPYKFIPYGDGHYNRSFTELVRLITAGVYDAAVGDIAITTNRTRMADFTQPYMESGLVVVAPVKKINQNAWAFLRPFTPLMWSVTALFFLIVGAVVWILEHRINDEFRGPPRKQLMTILWFSFSTMFFSHKENTVSTLGRLVLIIWLFVVLIITSSYTASLTSILTVQQLYSPVKGIESLITSNDPVGYQSGSFVPNYLSAEFGMQASRLVPFNSPEEYAEALRKGPKNGGVAAVVDERAYVELFLSTRCDQFSIVGQEFSKNGWGFAFPRESPLAVDMSTAILKLSETGELQRIHDKWLMGSACKDSKLEVDRLPLGSFKGLFLLCGLACLLALFIYFILVVRQFMIRRHYVEESESSGGSSRSAWLQTFLTFVDEKEEDVNNWSKRQQLERATASSKDHLQE